jgi:Na+-translocating ferredoxin:NAD+ oxidoreductase RnfC subunit
MINMDDYVEIIDSKTADKDIEMITAKLNEMHITEEKVKRGYHAYLKHLRYMRKYREKNKESIKGKRKRLEEEQPEIRRKRLKQNRDRYYKKKYGMTEEEYKGI